MLTPSTHTPSGARSQLPNHRSEDRQKRYANAFMPSLASTPESRTQDMYMDEKRALALAQADPLPGPSRPNSHYVPIRPPRSSSLSHLSMSDISSTASTPGVHPPARRLLLHSHLHSCRHSMMHSLPFVFYVVSSLLVFVALTMYRSEVFGALDQLAVWLRSEGSEGMLVLGGMIFITCIPPFPLYSTLQVLSGYTFGAFAGSIISYVSALIGATAVFLLCRHVPALHSPIASSLHHLPPIRRVVRAIARKPKLLFLVRLAPYPYNVLNALLAAAPGLTTRTYFTCTALSLVKVGIHTSVGAGIRSFAEFHNASGKNVTKGVTEGGEKAVDDDSAWLGQVSSAAGVILCVVIAVYLSYVARRAVDEELEDSEVDPSNCPNSTYFDADAYIPARRERYTGTTEEQAAFLSADDNYHDGDEMTEVSVAPYPPSRPPPTAAYHAPSIPSRPSRPLTGSPQEVFARAGLEEASIGLH